MPQAPIPLGKIMLVFALLALPLAIDFSWRGLRRPPPNPVWATVDGDPQQGRAAIQRYGCGACHTIPGIRIATGRVGPQLAGFREQIYIAGVLANTPENLAAWIQHPQDINPQTAMPDLQVSESEAQDIVAYLYSMR